MSHFRTKLAAWLFGLLCLGGVILTETSITTSPVPATADDDAAPTIESDLERKDSEIRDLVKELERVQKLVAQLEAKITDVQKRHDDDRRTFAHRKQRRPVRTNGPAPVDVQTQTPQDEALAAPLYSRSPLAQLNAMTSDIENRIAVLRERGDKRNANDTTTLLKKLTEQRAGDYPVVSDVPEIHMVGLYEASSAHHAIAPAKVNVTYTGAPIILALTSYEPVEWQIEISPDVQIDQVIVSGYYEQRVTGLPDSVPIWNESRKQGGQAFYAYKRTDSSFRKAVKRLHELAGRSVLTFQGAYRYPGKPFIVGPASSDWRTQHLVARMAPLHAHSTSETNEQARAAAQEIIFEGIYVSGTNEHGHGGSASWGQFTPNGPIKETLVKLPRIYKHVARNPDAEAWYGLDGGDVVKFELNGNRPTALTLPFGLPRLSWPCGLTFDAKRGRLLLSSLGGEGFLYAYNIGTEAWSLVSSMKGVDTQGLAWSRNDDCLYALSADHGDRTRYSLLKLTATGAVVETVKLGDGLPSLGHHPRIQLIPVDEKIVLLAAGEPVDSGREKPPTHSYLIDPKTGTIEYSAKLKPQKRPLAK